MSYLSELREKHPQLNDISDEEIIPYLPSIEPEIFNGKSNDEIRAIATQDNNWLADTGRLIWSTAKEATGQALTAVELATGSDWDIDDQLIKSGKETYSDIDVGVRKKIEKAGFQEESENSITGLAGATVKSLGSMVPYVASGIVGAAAVPFTGGTSIVAAPAAMNAAVIGGSNYHQVKDRIESLDKKSLADSGFFAGYMERANKFAQGDNAFLMARNQMAEDLAVDAAKDGAIIGGISGGLLGPALSKMLKGGQGVLKGAGTGAVTEGGQEFFEEGSQSLETEQALSKVTGKDIDYGRVARDAAFGTVLGASAGGAIGAASGATRRPQQAIEEELTENQGQPPLPSPESQVSNIPKEQYYNAIETPVALRTPEENQIISEYQAQNIAPTASPMESAQAEIARAGEEVVALGGDALDQATAKGQAQAGATPAAVRQEKKAVNERVSEISQDTEINSNQIPQAGNSIRPQSETVAITPAPPVDINTGEIINDLPSATLQNEEIQPVQTTEVSDINYNEALSHNNSTEQKPVISTEEFKQLQRSYQQVVRKAVSKRTEEEKATVKVYQQARKGEIIVSDLATVAVPSVDQQSALIEEQQANLPSVDIPIGVNTESQQAIETEINDTEQDNSEQSTLPKYSLKNSDERTGVSVSDTQKVANEFMESYNGNIPLRVRIAETQEELYGREGSEDRIGRFEGAYHPKDGILTITNLRDSSRSNIRKTLRHEVLGHYGLNTFKPEDKRAILDKIIASKNQLGLRSVWKDVQKRYADKSVDMQAEEVFASIAENTSSAPERLLDEVLVLINKALRNVGISKEPISRSELRKLAYTISTEIRSGKRKQQNFPESNDALFSQVSVGNNSDIAQAASPNQNSRTSLSLDTVKSAANSLGRRLKLRGVKVTVIETHERLPEVIKRQYVEDGIQGAVNAVYHENNIYIVADQMYSIAEVEEAILHETAHFGGEALLGSELNKVYQKLALKLGGVNGIRKKATEYGFNMDQYFELADEQVASGEMSVGQRSEFLVDEFLAHASGHQAYSSLPTRIKTAVQEFVGRVRDILRKLGAVELAEVSDSDIAYLLKRLRKAAKGEVKYADRPHFLSTTDADIHDIVQNYVDEDIELKVVEPKSTKPSNARNSSLVGESSSTIDGKGKAIQRTGSNSVEITPTKSNSSIDSRKTPNTDKARYSSARKDESFASFIERALQQTGRSGESYSLGNTPEVLQMLGADNLAIEITEGVIRKAVTGKHNLTAEVLQKIPDEINNPVMVFDSATEADSLIVLTELNNEEGLPVVVAVHLSKAKGRIEINSIASVHERSHARHIKNWIDQGLLAYRHKRKSRSWLQSRRLQLPWEGVKNDLRGNVITESALGKGKAKFSHSATSEQVTEADGSGIGASLDSMKSTFIRRIADKFQPLKEVQKSITDSGREISEEADAYQYEELFHGKAEEDLREMTDNFVEPLAKQMAEFDITQSDLDAYLYARHAPERNAHIASINPEMPEGGSGMSDKQAADIMRDVRSSGKESKYEQLASTIYDMTQAQRNVVRDNGLEDANIIDAWESKYEFYVPLKGYAANETESGRPSTGKGFSIGGKESKRALGRKSKADSPSAQVLQDLTEKLIRKRKNEVALSFLKLAEDHPDANAWSIYTDSNPEKNRTSKQVKDPETGEMKTVVTEQAVPMAMFSDRYFTAKRDGKTYYIKIEDPLLMNAMKNIGPENNSFIVKTLGKVIRFMSALNTSYNPEFALSNFPRDLQTAILNLEAEQSRDDGKVKGKKIAAQTVKDVPTAMKAVYRGLRGRPDMSNEWDVWFDEFLKSGAKTGYFDMKDLNEQQETVKTLVDIAKGGPKGKALQWGRATAKFVDDANSAVENAVRLAAYVNARKAGISEQKAASLVKNMTVNFNRRGELGTLINSLYMFANASIQGTMNFTRTMTGLNGEKGDPVWSRLNTAQKISFGMMAGAYALGMLNRSVAGEDDDGENFYDKIPAHDKERNIIIMKSFYGGKEGEYHKIPLAYGYNIFHVFGTSVEAVLGGDRPIGEEMARVGLAAAGSFSPIGFQHSDDAATMALKNVTPTLLKPIVDLTANENFMGSSIRNENSPFGVPKPDSSLARRSTPEGYKQISEFLNEMSGGSYYRSGYIDINPDSMRYLVGYFTGAAGNFAINKAPDNISRYVNDVELETHRTVFLGRANGKVLPYADVDKFYKRRDEVAQIEAEMKSLSGSERYKFLKENRSKLQLRAKIKSTEKMLKALRGKRNAIYTADLTLKERDLKLKSVEKQMKALIDRINKEYTQASK